MWEVKNRYKKEDILGSYIQTITYNEFCGYKWLILWDGE